MLRQNLTPSGTPPNHAPEPGSSPDSANAREDDVLRLDIQQSLNVLEEVVLSSPRVPFSRRTLIDEDQLLDQLDRIRLNLPHVFREAVQVMRQRNAILEEAERYAAEVVASAEQQAAQRLDDLGIIRQAELEAQHIKQQLQEECDALKAQTLAEIEQWQKSAQENWEITRQKTETECDALRQEADTYAASVLTHIEHQLSDMLRVVTNGRAALKKPPEALPPEAATRKREPAPPKALPQQGSAPQQRPPRRGRNGG